jgi:RNA polymerase sigma-70 factor, ECF subfamily
MSLTASNLDQPLDQAVVKAVGGDSAALELLLIHFHDPLLRYIRNSLFGGYRTGLTPEDTLQETFAEAFRQIRMIEARGEVAFHAWLKTIARTRYINQLKAAKAAKRGGQQRFLSPAGDETSTNIFNVIAGSDPTPSLVLRRHEVISALQDSLRVLNAVSQQVLDLRYGQGLSVREVAAIVGKSEGAVKLIVYRATKDLQAMLLEKFGTSRPDM